MRALRVAEKPGSHRAPREFVEMLRRETGNDKLECWWDPDVVRHGQHPRDPEGTHGCWVIWMKTRAPEAVQLGSPPFTAEVWHGIDMWVDVYALDGLFGRPMTLGRWVADVMNEADVTKRGGHRRAATLNRLERARLEAQEAEGRDAAFYMARDPAFRRVFARAAEGTGTPVTTREERIAAEKRLWDREARRQYWLDHDKRDADMTHRAPTRESAYR